jgi:hypothetical protein
MAWKLHHPDSDQELEVEADKVPMYQSQGWLTRQDEASTTPDPAPAAAAAILDPPSVPTQRKKT